MSTSTTERAIPESEVWKREARAYAQALLDRTGRHDEALVAYAMAEADECVYFNKQHRALFAAKLTAFFEAFIVGWDTGQTHGYQTGLEDGKMEAEQEAGK
jgi:hypothetical protein